jgi:carbonic anhydrase
MMCVTALAVLLGACASSDSRPAAVMTKAAQDAATPDSVLADLRAGNARFVRGTNTNYDWLTQASKTAKGQYPKAIILSCLDSRVVPELIFDQGIGDLFVGRVAGNFEDIDQLGSMEFGTKVAGAKLIVVLGHTSCGAVKGAIDRAELGNLTEMLGNIEPAVAATTPGSLGRTSKDTAYVDRVVEENVRLTTQDILQRSPVLAELVSTGSLKVVGGIYDLESGVVRWL